MCREISQTHNIWSSDGSHKTEEIVRPNLSEKLVSVFKYVVPCSSGLPTLSSSARSSFNTLEEKVAQALFRSCMDTKLWIYKRSCCFLSSLSMFCKRNMLYPDLTERRLGVIEGAHRWHCLEIFQDKSNIRIVFTSLSWANLKTRVLFDWPFISNGTPTEILRYAQSLLSWEAIGEENHAGGDGESKASDVELWLDAEEWPREWRGVLMWLSLRSRNANIHSLIVQLVLGRFDTHSYPSSPIWECLQSNAHRSALFHTFE